MFLEPLPADNLIKCKKKTYSEEEHLVNSRYELLTTKQQFCGDISTLFQSHCQTRMTLCFDNDFDIFILV